MPLQVPAHRKQSPAAIELLHQASRAHIGWAKTCKNARVVFKHSYRRCTSAEEATMNSSFFCLGCLQQQRGKNTYTNMLSTIFTSAYHREKYSAFLPPQILLKICKQLQYVTDKSNVFFCWLFHLKNFKFFFKPKRLI